MRFNNDHLDDGYEADIRCEGINMSFEDIPEDREESYPCPQCKNGNIHKNHEGEWECDYCEWVYDGEIDESRG